MQQVEVSFLGHGSVRGGQRLDGDRGWGWRVASMVVRNMNAWIFGKSFGAPVSSTVCLLSETVLDSRGMTR